MSLLLVPLVVIGCGVVAFAITTVIVTIADRLGLVYSASAEAKRYPEPPTLNHAARRRYPQ